MSASPDQKIAIVNVTPGMARRWLATNTNNRRLRRAHITSLVGIINRGEWALSNDALCFDPDGMLLNGQHRLNAIVETDRTLPLLVMRDVGRPTQLAMDTGAKRMAAEQMQILGIQGASTLKAALCRAILNYDSVTGAMSRAENVSNAEIIGLAEGDTHIDDALTYTHSLGRRIPSARVTMIGLGYYLLLEAWPDRVPDFHEKLAEGIGLGEKDPVRLMRNYLVTSARAATASDRRKTLALFLKTFNYWVDSKELELLRFSSEDDWPVPYTAQRYSRLLADRAKAARGFETRRKKATA